MIEAFTTSSLADYSRMTTRSGLVWDMAMLYMAVTDASGQKYGLTRAWEKTMTGMWMTGKFDPDVTQASERVFPRQYIGPINSDLDEDNQTATIQSWPSRHNFKVHIEVGRIHWEEEDGALNLDLKSLGPAYRYTDVGDGDYESQISTCEFFEVEGIFNGEHVTGLGCLDQPWYPPGIGFFHSKLYRYVQQIMIPWITRYDDGSVEYGVKANFADDVNWGFYVTDGTPTLGENCSIDTTWGDADGTEIPLKADIQYGDHRFKWVADGRMGIIKGNMNWVSGKMINTQKDAKPVETFAWNEFRANS